MELELEPYIKRVKKLSAELDKRIAQHGKLEPYLEGDCPLPEAVTKAGLKKVYRHLMPVSEAPWGALIVGSKLDRLEVSGLRDADNQAGAERIWIEAWQANEMDSESKLAHDAALLDGRCYATVWPGKGSAPPEISLDDVTQMIVEFAPGSRRKRVAALRRWEEDGTVYATLYLPEGIFKFKGPDNSANTGNVEWEKREVNGEDWPLANPFNPLVPVVEIAVNRRLKSGAFPYARGEFQHCVGLIDRINLLTFLGLIVAFWQGFPLRGVIGEKIRHELLVDDEGKPIFNEDGKQKTKQVPPFTAAPDSVFQLENHEAKLAEFKGADRKNLSVYGELDQLAVITSTPRHYFPLEGGIANVNAETVGALEGSMHAAVHGHQASMGSLGWKQVAQLCGLALKKPVVLTPRATIMWHDHEGRSLAEKADAASKLKDLIPRVAIAEKVLGASQDELAHWASIEATNPLLNLVAAAAAEERQSVAI